MKTVAMNVVQYMANANLVSAAHCTMSVATLHITAICPLDVKENGVFAIKHYVSLPLNNLPTMEMKNLICNLFCLK